MSRSKNYRLREEYAFGPINDLKTIPKDAFVRPIQECYVPRHCFDAPAAKWYSKDRDIFCYCSVGIIPIPKDIIYEVD